MSINIDFSTANTVDELSALTSDLEKSFDTVTVDLEQSAKDLVDSSISNCSVFGSMQGLVKDAADSLTSTVKSLTGSVQQTITELMKSVSDVVKNAKDRFKNAITELNNTIKGLTDSMAVLINNLKLKANELIGSINTLLTDFTSSISNIMSSIMDVFSSFADGLKKMFAVNCNTVSTALQGMSSGAGAGVDSLIDTAKQGADNIINNTMSGVTDTLGKFDASSLDFKNSISALDSHFDGIDSIISDIGNIQ